MNKLTFSRLIVLRTSYAILAFLFISTQCHSQQSESNIWYFGNYAGLDFSNGGSPSALTNGSLNALEGCASMSSPEGELLFYTEGDTVWQRDHQVMPNGTGLMGHNSSTQSAIVVPKPGSEGLYYIFTVDAANHNLANGLRYSLVDMSLNGGYGDIDPQQKNILLVTPVCEKVTAVHNKSGSGTWVIVHLYNTNIYHSYLVTQFGVSQTPVVSQAGVVVSGGYINAKGYMTVSPDGTMLAEANHYLQSVEIFDFNTETGVLSNPIIDNTYLFYDVPYGVAFSANSSVLYVSNWEGMARLYQYDLNAGTPQDIIDSRRVLFEPDEHPGALQLGPDLRIYVALYDQSKISVITNPNVYGDGCNYVHKGVSLNNRISQFGLPPFIQSYFNPVVTINSDTVCFGTPTNFSGDISFNQDSLIWDFGDPASGLLNYSTLINPSHLYTDSGEFIVSLTAYYYGQAFESHDTIYVAMPPDPKLGSDTIVCQNTSLILNANCGGDVFEWSTGQSGTPEITVIDTGWYWVRVEIDAGCYGIDSIHLSNYPPVIADTSNLKISPTTCGGSTGVIKGLQIDGMQPLSWYWQDDLGNTVSTSLDIYHLPVGNYTLEVLDGNGCIKEFGPYHVYDAGDVLIESLDYSIEHCSQQDASIRINAISGLGEMLFFSIDNGLNYYANEGIFTGLSAGTYAIRVKDSSDCQDVYVNNPVVIDDLDAPEIVDVQIGACTSGQSNGSIEITALGSGDTLYYSNDNGQNYQVNNGGFFNLPAGFYTCVVLDKVGCDTTFVVEVPEEISLRLQALAGEDEACPGNAAFVPLYVSNFNDVANFKTTLLYDQSLINCTGFANAHTQLEDSLEVMLFPAEGKIELLWHSAALTLPDNTPIADLVFASLDPGISMVAWDGSAGASLFQNVAGLTIPVDYYIGSVKIYEEVFFTIDPLVEACQGDDVEISPMLWSSNGDVSYLWTYPSGNTSNQEILSIYNIQQSHSGTYSLHVSDTLDCFSEASVNITVHPAPVPAFSGQDTIVTEEPVEIDAGSAYASYLWNTGETGQSISVEYEDWYSVIIESHFGCYGQDSVYILFWEPPEPLYDHFHFPNAFTPDGDGLNDEFKAIGQPDNLASFSMKIFNRWGQMVFESHEVSLGWNGTCDGRKVSNGTYVYRVEYSIDNYEFDVSGTLAVIR